MTEYSVVDQDPYALLGVSRHVDRRALQLAYEGKLMEARRFGALRQAQDYDRAYEVLRDDSRRALYDRHGVSTPLSRVHPLERYVAPRAVPFRNWSPPPERSVPHQPGNATGRSRHVIIGLLVLSAMSWGAYTWTQLRQAEPAAPVGRTQIQVVCDATPTGAAYSDLAPEGSPVGCANGAAARWSLAPAR